MMHVLSEIWEVAYSNRDKSRNAGFTVAWGIFILMLLTATGNGLQDGIKTLLSDFTVNSIDIYAGQVSISNSTVTKGDYIDFDETISTQIKRNFNEVKHLSPIVTVPDQKMFSDLNTTTRFSLLGVDEDYFKIKTSKLEYGRFFNFKDQGSYFVVIGNDIATTMFNNSNALGRILFLGNRGYKVIGVLKKDGFLSDTGRSVFMPLDIATSINKSNNFDNFVLSLNNRIDNVAYQKTLHTYLKKLKNVHYKDNTAFYLNNPAEILKTFNTIFKAINLFLWFIGISFLISGMLSIYNVMTIIVQDRTGEFGIRKSLGATPISIQKMVLFEALIITLVSGIVGIIAGYILIALINIYIGITSEDAFMILVVNPYIILAGIVLLIVAGCIAGIVPARKASHILPVEALRSLNN